MKGMTRRGESAGKGPGEDLFDRAREVADALKEVPEVAATEYSTGKSSIRILFAVPDRHVGDLIRRIFEGFRREPDVPEAAYRIGIYDLDDRNIILNLDIDGEHAGPVRDALKGIRRC
ncbi:MAG: hypothetical protein LUQ32_10070 [Methanomicrobiales archaeon]|nr:hypothetical protein [Methanomicrobiales archaeon]